MGVTFHYNLFIAGIVVGPQLREQGINIVKAIYITPFLNGRGLTLACSRIRQGRFLLDGEYVSKVGN